jgi:hypothetical protein
LKMEIAEIRALKSDISETNARSMKELADLRHSINTMAQERELAEAEETKVRRK